MSCLNVQRRGCGGCRCLHPANRLTKICRLFFVPPRSWSLQLCPHLNWFPFSFWTRRKDGISSLALVWLKNKNERSNLLLANPPTAPICSSTASNDLPLAPAALCNPSTFLCSFKWAFVPVLKECFELHGPLRFIFSPPGNDGSFARGSETESAHCACTLSLKLTAEMCPQMANMTSDYYGLSLLGKLHNTGML